MPSPVATGVSAATALVREFAQTASLKVNPGGPTKTRTQIAIEQVKAADAAAVLSGRGKLSNTMIGELIKLQAS